MARTRKSPVKKDRKIPKISKPTFIGRILKKVWRFLLMPFRPFQFILAPFKTRPVRFVGRTLNKILLIDYFMLSWKEIKLVTWPGKKETTQLTIAVFIFAIGFGVLIAIIDFGFSKLFEEVILK